MFLLLCFFVVFVRQATNDGGAVWRAKINTVFKHLFRGYSWFRFTHHHPPEEGGSEGPVGPCENRRRGANEE